MSVEEIAKCEVKNLVTGTVTTLDKFWQDRNCAVIFFQRWGCQYCRVYAQGLSDIVPILKNYDIDMVGVGLEEYGAQDFVQGNFFNGDLYVDNNNKAIYKTMVFKRFYWLRIFPTLLWSDSWAAHNKIKELHVAGNLSGDGLQTGGVLLVNKGGDVLLEFKQHKPGQQLTNADILEAFGLKDEVKNLPKQNLQENPEYSDNNACAT